MRKIRTVAAAVLSGAALLFLAPYALAAEPVTSLAPPVDVDLEVEVLDDQRGPLLQAAEPVSFVPPFAPVGAEPGLG
ncbi:hypothetical protein JOF53_001662 [Crossiella equi]|uniref:Uncharacterized protein n=1 Tax=Crossiella equi TaxID=130796 RepID=A0ABS5A885_9PSEU|nr:hypothetical protein [Crossiella equi]MBP2472790.1 hypothetical protein [Crossiella equi]